MSDNGKFYHPKTNMPAGVIYYIESGGTPKDDENWKPVSPIEAWNILAGYRSEQTGVLFDEMICDGLERGWTWHHGYSWFKFVPRKD